MDADPATVISVLKQMKAAGLSNVRVIPAKVPHWVRGAESARHRDLQDVAATLGDGPRYLESDERPPGLET